jgi:SH3-like domain-containing protein
VGGSAAITYRHEVAAPPGVVIAEQAVVRQGNYEESEPVFTGPVHSGTEVRIIETRDAWMRVEFPNGKDGWVRRETVERI